MANLDDQGLENDIIDVLNREIEALNLRNLKLKNSKKNEKADPFKLAIKRNKRGNNIIARKLKGLSIFQTKRIKQKKKKSEIDFLEDDNRMKNGFLGMLSKKGKKYYK